MRSPEKWPKPHEERSFNHCDRLTARKERQDDWRGSFGLPRSVIGNRRDFGSHVQGSSLRLELPRRTSHELANTLDTAARHPGLAVSVLIGI